MSWNCFSLCSSFLFAFILAFVYLFSQHRKRPPIFGVYNIPGKWFLIKYLFFRILLFLRKAQTKNKKPDYNEIDRPQPLSKHPLAFDAVFFIGADKGGRYLIMGAERRQNSIVNGLCYLLIPEAGGLLCSIKLPDTVLFGAEPEQFGAEGICATMIEPLQKWHLQFNGPMRIHSDRERIMDVALDVTWEACSKPFSFDTDTPHHVLARTIATEPWSRKYFNQLKMAHQCHYEQMGNIKGTVSINKIEYPLKMSGFRDHSFGYKRDWTLMHRYAFHMFFLENGVCGSVIVVCQPATCTTLQGGFLTFPNGSIAPIEWCDLLLYQHGETGVPPKDYAFTLSAGGEIYHVAIEVVKESIHFVGFDWEARMVERFIRCRVDGIHGRGVSEFHYRNRSGRKPYETDPKWFAKMPKS